MLTLAIPVYNMEQYLPRCMETMLAQTCQDFEILLVDDGSTDNSGQMCDDYAAKHSDFIRVVHKENGGLSSARNAGIDAAKGKYPFFLKEAERLLKPQGIIIADNVLYKVLSVIIAYLILSIAWSSIFITSSTPLSNLSESHAYVVNS